MTADLTKCFVHFGLPCYGGQFTEPFFTSFVRFVLAAERVGLKWAVDTQPNDSLVTRARNNLMAKMLANQHATHFMFIDADIRVIELDSKKHEPSVATIMKSLPPEEQEALKPPR